MTIRWTPERLVELVALGRAGRTWREVAVALGVAERSNNLCRVLFMRNASAEDMEARAAALRRRCTGILSAAARRPPFAGGWPRLSNIEPRWDFHGQDDPRAQRDHGSFAMPSRAALDGRGSLVRSSMGWAWGN